MTRQSHNSNFYAVLNIRTDATSAEVRAAYHRAALRTHPDKGGSSEEFRLASRAFEVLSCQASRRSYDSNMLLPSEGAATRTITTNTVAATTSPRPRCKRMSSFPVRHTRVKRQPLHTTLAAMHRLREVLQAMTVKSRREVFTGMTPAMRKAIASFMACSSCEVSPHMRSSRAFGARPARHKPQSSATGIRTCNRARRMMYQAQMHVKALRLYARPQECLDSAINHQIHFSHLRNALAVEEKADPSIWFDAKKTHHVCQTVLEEMGTSENNLGLRAFVHIRAHSWLGQSVQITSSSTTLSTALDAHARLLRARAATWQVFRAEWIRLMLSKGRLTLMEAEAVVDKARQDALQRQIAKALRGVEQALNKEQRRTRKRIVEDDKLLPKRTRMSNVAFMGG